MTTTSNGVSLALLLSTLCCGGVPEQSPAKVGTLSQAEGGVCECMSWKLDQACNADCVKGYEWCQARNWKGVYQGPIVLDPCLALEHGGVNACDVQFDCYQCTRWAGPPGCEDGP